MNQKTKQKSKRVQTFENLEEGDKILFNGRKEPLTVNDVKTNEPLKPRHTESKTVHVKSSRGTFYSLIQSLVNNKSIGIVSLGRSRHCDKGQVRELEVVE